MLEFIHMLILIRRVLSPKTCFGVGPLIIVKKKKEREFNLFFFFHLSPLYILFIMDSVQSLLPYLIPAVIAAGSAYFFLNKQSKESRFIKIFIR